MSLAHASDTTPTSFPRALTLFVLFAALLSACGQSSTGSTTATTATAAANNAVIYAYVLDSAVASVPVIAAYDAKTGARVRKIPAGDTGNCNCDQGSATTLSGHTLLYGFEALRALDISTGTELWNVPVSYATTTPVVVGDTVLVGGGVEQGGQGQLYAFSLHDGSLRWRHSVEVSQLTSADPSPIAVHNGTIYVCGEDTGDPGARTPEVAAYDVASGSQLWTSPQRCNSLVWTPDGIFASVFFPYDAPLGTMLDAQTGKRLWSSNTASGAKGATTITATPAGIIAVAGATVTRLDPRTGAALWQAQWQSLVAGRQIHNGAVYEITANADSVYFISGPNGGDVVAYDAATGAQRWLTPGSGQLHTLTQGPGALYAQTADGKTVVAYNATTGKRIWSQQLNAHRVLPTADALFTTNNDLYGEEHFGISRVDPKTGKTLWTDSDFAQVIPATLP